MLDDELEAIEADAYTVVIEEDSTAPAEAVAEVIQYQAVAFLAWARHFTVRTGGSEKKRSRVKQGQRKWGSQLNSPVYILRRGAEI